MDLTRATATGRGSRPGRILPAAFIACLAPFLGERAAAGTPHIPVAPGPVVMSQAEKSLSPDPASEKQGAVVLVEEGEEHDLVNPGGKKTIIPLLFLTVVRTAGPEIEGSVVTRHRRAKVFSEEGRAMGDISIPLIEGHESIERFWGRTILPDGSVKELKKEDLQLQMLVQTEKTTLLAARAALPGVVPGCVIDYGYTLRRDRVPMLRRVAVQGSWPIKEFRFRWMTSLPSADIGRHGTVGLKFESRRAPEGFRFSARDLPPAVEEPWMPPAGDVHASVTLYYHSGAAGEVYWNAVAQSIRESGESFLDSRRAVKKAIESMGVSRDDDLGARLETAYDWIEANVRNDSLPGSAEGSAEGDGEPPASMRDVLNRRSGSSLQLAFLLMGVVRELGAEASVVLVPDRRERSFDRAIVDASQLDGALVSIGATVYPKDLFAAPGWGLPYGEVPWWHSGTDGLRVTVAGAGYVTTDHSAAEANVSETVGRLSLGEAGEPLHASWKTTGSGQVGYVERLNLRRMSGAARQSRLDQLCGGGSPAEIVRALAPRVDDIRSPYELECEIELASPNDMIQPDSRSATFEGPWIPDVPELVPEARVYKVVFEHARVERTSLAIAAPAGFSPSGPPEPVSVQSPFGSYSLAVVSGPSGFKVERRFSLSRTDIAVEEYRSLRSFLSDVRRADRTNLRFVRTAGNRAGLEAR